MEGNIEEYIVEIEDGDNAIFGRKSEIDSEIGIAKKERAELCTREVEQYLLSYRTTLRMMEMNRYEKGYFAYPAIDVPIEESEAYLKARLYEIRAFILDLEECDEKLFLYYHFVHGESMERCAELLAVSRATVYRIRKRALRLAAELYATRRPIAL